MIFRCHYSVLYFAITISDILCSYFSLVLISQMLRLLLISNIHRLQKIHEFKEFSKTTLKGVIEPLKHLSCLQFDCLFAIQ